MAAADADDSRQPEKTRTKKYFAHDRINNISTTCSYCSSASFHHKNSSSLSSLIIVSSLHCFYILATFCVFVTYPIVVQCEKISYEDSKSWRPIGSTAGGSSKERRSAFVLNPHFETPPSDLNINKVVPCDISNEIAGACSTPGDHYPWHKLQSFIRDNQAMMKRMYGADFVDYKSRSASSPPPHLRAQGPAMRDDSRSAFARSTGGGGGGGGSSSVVNACPSEQFVITPFWANNSDGETVAVVNFHPFEQAVQQEVCKPGIQGRCRDGCVCEQKFAWYRLLAFDPKDDCRGIFMDWFQFPSCCACRCYQLPIAEKSAVSNFHDDSLQQTSAATTRSSSVTQDDDMPTSKTLPSSKTTADQQKSSSSLPSASTTPTPTAAYYAAAAENEVYYHPSTKLPSTNIDNTLIERQQQVVAKVELVPRISQSPQTAASVSTTAKSTTAASLASDHQQQLHDLLTETAAALRRSSAAQKNTTAERQTTTGEASAATNAPKTAETGKPVVFVEDAAAHQVELPLTKTEQRKQPESYTPTSTTASQNESERRRRIRHSGVLGLRFRRRERWEKIGEQSGGVRRKS